MQREIKANKQERKTWETPELRRLSAGSAEAGNNVIGDGSGPGNPRS